MLNAPVLRIPLLSVLTMFGLTSVPHAVADSIATYDVSHTFTFTPEGGVTPPVNYVHSESAASPDGVPQIDSDSVVLGSRGGSSSETVHSADSLSSATAASSAIVDGFSSGAPISGTISSDGIIALSTPRSTCCAISKSAIVIGGDATFHHGSADYAPEMSMRGFGGPENGSREEDPIAFQVTDLKSGPVTQGQLFEVLADLNGAGSWSWAANSFTVNAVNFDFSIDINGSFTAQQGSAALAIRNGIITTSEGSGMFAGLFPAVGSPGNFSSLFGNSFHLDYELGNFGGDPANVQFTFGNSGSSCLTPEPSTLGLIAAVLAGALVRKRGHQNRLRMAQ